MGMYTQIRGWLNVDSIAYKNEDKINKIFNSAKEEFESRDDLDRKWVCEDTIIHFGGNGSAWIFIGTEMKNYDNSMNEWINTIIKYFPNAEGRIDYQYELDDKESGSRYLLIHNGKIIKDGICEPWCIGYGNMFEGK